MKIHTKRAYDKPARNDGCRVLVDGMWPRGVKKEDAQVDLWLKEIAPSAELRKWFGHDPEKWDEFKKKYFKELDGDSDATDQLAEKARQGRVTLIYGAKDTEHNNAIALRQYLEENKRI